MFFSLFVTGLNVVEYAHPQGEAKEVLRCPDARGGQGNCWRLWSPITGGLFADHARRQAIDILCWAMA